MHRARRCAARSEIRKSRFLGRYDRLAHLPSAARAGRRPATPRLRLQRFFTDSFLTPALAALDHSRRRAGTAFLHAHSVSAMSGARYERRDDRYRDDRRDREWYVPRDHHRLARGRNRSVLHDRWLRRFIHATIDDGVPRISRRHETRATRTETFATFIADFTLPPTFPVHPSPQGPEGRR